MYADYQVKVAFCWQQIDSNGINTDRFRRKFSIINTLKKYEWREHAMPI